VPLEVRAVVQNEADNLYFLDIITQDETAEIESSEIISNQEDEGCKKDISCRQPPVLSVYPFIQCNTNSLIKRI